MFDEWEWRTAKTVGLDEQKRFKLLWQNILGLDNSLANIKVLHIHVPWNTDCVLRLVSFSAVCVTHCFDFCAIVWELVKMIHIGRWVRPTYVITGKQNQADGGITSVVSLTQLWVVWMDACVHINAEAKALIISSYKCVGVTNGVNLVSGCVESLCWKVRNSKTATICERCVSLTHLHVCQALVIASLSHPHSHKHRKWKKRGNSCAELIPGQCTWTIESECRIRVSLHDKLKYCVRESEYICLNYLCHCKLCKDSNPII